MAFRSEGLRFCFAQRHCSLRQHCFYLPNLRRKMQCLRLAREFRIGDDDSVISNRNSSTSIQDHPWLSQHRAGGNHQFDEGSRLGIR